MPVDSLKNGIVGAAAIITMPVWAPIYALYLFWLVLGEIGRDCIEAYESWLPESK